MRSQRQSLEEDSFSILEYNLGLGKHPAKDIDFVIRKFSAGAEINVHQFEEIKRQLLPKLSYSEWPELLAFFEMFQTQSGCYEKRGLLVLGVFLGTGSSMKKAELIFQIFDERHERVVKKTMIYDLVECVLSIALCRMPLLANDKLRCPVKAKAIHDYAASLLKRRVQGKIELVKLFFRFDLGQGEDLSKSQFIRLFTLDLEMEKLLSFSGVRKFILQNISQEDGSTQLVFDGTFN